MWMRKMGMSLCSFLCLFSALNGLELKRVILSTNNNPLYIEFWPVVAPLWEAMGLRPTLALIASKDCPIDTTIGDVIRLDPLPGIPESLQAQVVRLFLPCLFPEEGCLISDIDMLPISQSYFREGASHCPDDNFLVYREGYQITNFPMCYVAAKGCVFSDIFQVFNREQIYERIYQWAQFGYGWNTDEVMLYKSATAWEQRGGHIIRLRHGADGRLDRGNWQTDISKIRISDYIDCHCPRPYSAYQSSIDPIVQAIQERSKK
ncbi:MAG: hypothetical protein JSS10_04790 [Verrucomicrobia bacterium]|nr:hypothetical protein [Verrucomicrobiota bacterium]